MRYRYMFFIIFFLFAVVACIYIWLSVSENVISEGVYIFGKHLGGKTLRQAEDQIKKISDQMNKNKVLTLNYGNFTYKLNLEDTGISIDSYATACRAYEATQKGNFLYNIAERIKLKFTPVSIRPVIAVNEEKWANLIQKINSNVFLPSKPALFVERNGKLEIIPSQDGREVDVAMLKSDIKATLNLPNQNDAISIPIKKIPPVFTTQDAQRLNIHALLSTYTTRVSQSNRSRWQNIKTAAEKLNGTVLKPGEEFSFNKVVGDRTFDLGYEKAPVFVRNKVELDVGGGVCQVSTTLYNAALLADLYIVERSSHSMPVAYVPPGRDATVVYGSIDLKFKNASNNNIVIMTGVTPTDLIIKIFGSEPLNKKIHLETNKLKTYPPGIKIQKDTSLKPGEIRIEEGISGYEAEVWKISKQGDKILEKVLISKNKYNSRDTVIYTSALE